MYLSNVSVGNFFCVLLPQLVFMYFASAVGLTAIALVISYAVTLSAASSLSLAIVAGLVYCTGYGLSDQLAKVA
jgi:hypothetical protein